MVDQTAPDKFSRPRKGAAVAASRRQQTVVNTILLAPSIIVISIAFLVPIAIVLKNSLLMNDRLSLFYFEKFLSDPYYLGVLWRTLRLGVLGTVLTLIPGYVLAYNMVFHPRPAFRMLVVAVTLVPLVVNLVVRVFGWISILSLQGTIHELLGIFGFGDVQVHLLFTEEAVIIGFVHSHLTFMVLPVAGALSKIDGSLLRAAENLGAASWRRFFHVILPLSLPGIVAGSLLCFALNISDFIVPLLLGGERRPMMTYLIYEQQLFLANDNFSAAQTVILMTVSALAIFSGLWLAALFSRRFAT
jgi:putative spermidine/putrescine transport system permease protein